MTDTITLIGTVATQVKTHRTGSGIAISTFRLASTQRRYDRTKNLWIDGETNWYTVSSYRQLADHAQASLSKGDRVFVAGRLRIRHWQKEERSGTAVEIDAESLGHDLLFGTTTYHRDLNRGQHEAASRTDGLAATEPSHDHGQTAPQDPAGTDPNSTAVARPGSPDLLASAPEQPVVAGATPPDPAPGWHVPSEEVPF